MSHLQSKLEGKQGHPLFLRSLSNGTGAAAIVWSYAYDLRRLPTTETLTLDGRSRSRSIGHAYDPYGHEQTLTYPDGLAINTAPNALGQPTQAGSYAAGIGYFPNGGMSGFSYHNGIIHSLTQNTRELPLESRDQKPGQAAILDDTYTYDADGNVAAIADGTPANGNSRTMAYDGLDRLTQTNAPNQWWISATTTYDALDNIRSNQVGNTAAYLNTYAYDPTTWHLTNLAGRSNWTLAYDANGNITGKGAGNDSYVFDAANRMTQVTGKESYRYDGHGRRAKITRASDGKLDYPIYSLSGQLITEDDQRSNTSTDYVSLNGSLVAKRSAPMGTSTWTTTYEHTDALRSPSYETNASATLTRAERYTPYGEPGDGQYMQGPGYIGHVTDAATRLTYAQQRYYDPVMGRFLSTDPVLADDKGGDFNRYWYANNDPYRFTDPSGRYTCSGGKADCAAIATFYNNAVASMKNLDPKSAGYQQIDAATSYLGKPDEDNGVKVVATSISGRAYGDTSKGGPIEIDVGKAKTFGSMLKSTGRDANKTEQEVQNAVGAGVLVHEATHQIDYLNSRSGDPHSLADTHALEVRAFSAERAVGAGLGMEEIGLSTQHEFDSHVDESVKEDCRAAGGCQ